jgi:hypothetical protein
MKLRVKLRVVVLVCIIVAFIILSPVNDYFIFKRSHPIDFPRVSCEDDFLTKQECKELEKYILNHDILKRLWSDSYLVKFNLSDYSKKQFSDNNLEKIYDIFERIKQPNTNAYIMNTAILSETATIDEDKRIHWHYDDSIQIKDTFNRNILPVCTTILYISLPENFTGGRLNLKSFGSFSLYCKSYTPIQGRKFTFRGDTFHSVEPFTCEKGEKRISLVFEQYKIPDKYMHLTNFKITRR